MVGGDLCHARAEADHIDEQFVRPEGHPVDVGIQRLGAGGLAQVHEHAAQVCARACVASASGQSSAARVSRACAPGIVAR